MKIVFMGTPDFAVDTLKTLSQSRHEVVGVVTQPDKPKGRGGKMCFSPVKEEAVRQGISVYQPKKLREEEFLRQLRMLQPDVIIVVAFGQILPKEILEMPQYGCLNVHASLLPKLRGAAPIQWSVILGEKESGITIMQMDEGLDTGDILLTQKCPIDAKETGGSLFDKLSVLGGPMVLEVLEACEQGTLCPVPQEEQEHTYAHMLSKENGQIDFTKSAVEIERLIRGLNPWPSAYCFLKNKLLKIWKAEALSEKGVAVEDMVELPGTVVKVNKNDFVVKTGEGYLQVLSVQLEGKKRMDTAAFLRGCPLEKGMLLQSDRA